MTAPLISKTPKGLYCSQGDFYIDPSRAVETAIVTHAHSDHARRGSKRYICALSSIELLKCRLGSKIQVEGLEYGRKIRLGEVEVSLHPAGHMLGSAQVRVQEGGEVWVASGDYKRDPDPSCEPFEAVACDTFITEATFGTPKFRWEKSRNHGRDIFEWWQANAREGVNSLVFGYSLGKAQRILTELAPHAERPVLIHESIHEGTECYRRQGRALAPTELLGSVHSFDGRDLILAPPSILDSEWKKRLGKVRTAFASGWMHGSGGSYVRPGSYDHGFLMSDHADWTDLNRTIQETGAQRVFVQHRDGALIRHLRSQGLEAYSEDELIPENFARLEPKNLSLAF